MSMKLSIRRGTWEMSVSDQGGGDPQELDKLLHSDDVPDLEDERGRGFFLLNAMVERLSVQRSEDGRGVTVIAAAHYGERA
jgi:anti-sigma regulatory factor (Ser/Thr protein kinase)